MMSGRVIAFYITIASIYFGLFALNAKRAFFAPVVTTPGGDIINSGNDSLDEEIMTFIAEPLEDDYFFFYPFSPLLPFLSAREHVSR